MQECTIIRLEYLKFYRLLDTNPDILWRLFQDTAEKLHYSYIVKLTSATPESRLLAVFNYLKGCHQNHNIPYSYKIPYTRKDIASLTGLRVETVIRTVKKMEIEKKLKIEKRKIFY